MGLTQSKKAGKKSHQQKWRKHTRYTYKEGEKKARKHSFIPRLQGDEKERQTDGGEHESKQYDGRKRHMDLFRSFSAPVQMEVNRTKLPRVTRLMSVHQSTREVVELYWSPKSETSRDGLVRGKSSTPSVLQRSGLADKNDCRDLADEFQNKLIQVSRWSGEEHDDTVKQQVNFEHIQEGAGWRQS